MNQSTFFQPGTLGPLTLKNRSIRAAAFEGMSQQHSVTNDLIDYHTRLAEGGVALTTVAYASVSKNGLSFPHQLLVSNENIPGLKALTDSVHQKGGLASIQIGHCGNMANRSVTGSPVLSPSGGINWYGPAFTYKLDHKAIKKIILDFGQAVKIAVNSGFDAIEVHAGHGYLISQFLSPYTNKRNDYYGGSFENRSRFLKEVLSNVKEVLPSYMALLIKMNSNDGFEGGVTSEETLQIARIIEDCGVHAIITSGGFVSRAPMYVMRGSMPVNILAYFIQEKWKKFFVKQFGKILIPSVPFKEGFFMEEASRIQKVVSIPVIPVGGMNSMKTIQAAMQEGFGFVAIARALIQNTNFINDLQQEIISKSDCTICNYCVAKMYSGKMECHLNQLDIPLELKQEIKAMTHE